MEFLYTYFWWVFAQVPTYGSGIIPMRGLWVSFRNGFEGLLTLTTAVKLYVIWCNWIVIIPMAASSVLGFVLEEVSSPFVDGKYERLFVDGGADLSYMESFIMRQDASITSAFGKVNAMEMSTIDGAVNSQCKLTSKKDRVPVETRRCWFPQCRLNTISVAPVVFGTQVTASSHRNMWCMRPCCPLFPMVGKTLKWLLRTNRKDLMSVSETRLLRNEFTKCLVMCRERMMILSL